MNFFTRFPRSFAALFSASVLMIPLLASCGGGGGDGVSNRPSLGAIPSETPTPAPSCGGKTFAPNYAPFVSLRRWQVFPLRVFFLQDNRNSVERQLAALAGFNQYVSATGGRANYILVDDPSKANVLVNFYFLTGGNTLGLTTTSSRNNIIESATIELGVTGDAREDQSTAAHEYGHLLGVGGHSPNQDDLMYFTGNLSGRVTTADLNTILTAYCNTFNRDNNRTSTPTGPLETFSIR